MKLGALAGRLPTDQITKRIPGGRKKASPLNKLPIGKLPLPAGKTAGTAGGVLLGLGAAAVAAQATRRIGNGRPQEGDGEQNPSGNAENAEDAGDTESDEGDERAAGDGESQDGGGKGIFGGIKDALGKKGGGGSGNKVKVTNIEEHLDIGAPRRLVYDQWTLFQDYPSFMKKVVSVDQVSDEKLNWKAKIFWSSRTWESTIVEQVPDRHISWRSTGAKGHVDGTVSFHKLAPNLTRVLLVLEYHPQGLFERTGNLWRAQGRRARLELKHFRRHVMTHSLLNPDEVEGWRGEIRDSEVVRTHDDALAEEKDRADDHAEDEVEDEAVYEEAAR
ncbi:hypothetical protein GCM10023085_31530 [Actinomadura viridis]|uniref:Membrane protein n=1 Tax=Actinomadura viridis TaxID=58110 RepID=A0A931DH64_9ACTN|nr:SRPBCC family protein [Actinomadura viridis]MBG6086835.1 putative membrane protein [Actinomadura viridis]